MKKAFTIFIPVCMSLMVFSCGRTQKRSTGHDFLLDDLPRVKLALDIYNHTQGFVKREERIGFQGQAIQISIKQLDVNGVDMRRIVVREGRLGALVAYSRLGECEFPVPEKNSNYTIYLMNASYGADYRAVDVRVGLYQGNLQFPRRMSWFREDREGFGGEAEPIEQTIADLNSALSYDWAEYGRFYQVSEKSLCHFALGYGFCEDQYGWHSFRWAGVNPVHCREFTFKRETFLEEVFELVTGTENIGGRDTASLIADPKSGGLNAAGRDLLAYLFVKDIQGLF